MRIWMLPKYNPSNLYNILLSKGLENNGALVYDLKRNDILRIKTGDIVHLHWPHTLYQSNNIIVLLFKSALLIIFLHILKIKGVKLVWTMHNVYPHKVVYRRLEKFIRKRIIAAMDIIFTNAYSIKGIVSKEFNISEDKIKVSLHGSYEGAYLKQDTDYKKKYRIPKDAYIYLFFGNIDRYKGVDGLISTFKTIHEDQTILLIVGKVNKEYETTIQKLINERNIITDFRFIPDEEVAGIFELANIVVLPYKEVTSSGSAILAVSLHKPIVCPKTPFIGEYFNEKIAVTYNSKDKDGLYNAMIYSKKNMGNIDDHEFRKKLDELNWNGIAKDMIKEYKKI